MKGARGGKVASMAAGRNEAQTAGGVLSVSIEGNIGAGKSSLLPLVSDREGPLPSGSVETHPEPLEKWQRVGDDGHSNLLAAFYDDPSRWSYTFQVSLTIFCDSLRCTSSNTYCAKLVSLPLHTAELRVHHSF